MKRLPALRGGEALHGLTRPATKLNIFEQLALTPSGLVPMYPDLLGFIGIARIFNYEPVKKDSLLLLYVLFVREGG